MKRGWMIFGIVVAVVVIVIGCYKWPVRLTKMNTSEVGLIVLQDGTTGNRVEISDTETIEKVMGQFHSIKMRRGKLSAGYGGYHIWVRVCKPDMEIVSDFTVSGKGYIRKDPFFYTISEGTIDVEYLELLIAEAQNTEE